MVPLLCASLTSATASAQVQDLTRPTYGAPAPTLSLELVQPTHTAQVTWDSLKGSAVVVEFWATWCSGCVAQIPHLNELMAKVKDKPVRFISVTDEDRSVVTAFLLRRPISGWVALDPGSVTFKRFAIYGRPYTALIDASGVLRGMAAPTEVNEAVIDQLLEGTLAMKLPTKGTPIIGTEPNGPLPLLQTLVRPAMPVSEVGMSPNAQRRTGNRWEGWGMDLKALLIGAYGVSEVRLVLPDNLPKTRYDLSIVLPDASPDSFKGILVQLVSAVFNVRVRRESRQVDVFVLRKGTGASGLQPSENGRPMRAVVGMAESVLKRVVVDETGLTDRYVFVLAYPKSEQEFLSAINGMGLDLVPERRSVEVLVVEPTPPG